MKQNSMIDMARNLIAQVCVAVERLSEAKELFQLNVSLSREAGGKHRLARHLAGLALAEFALGDRNCALAHIQEATGLFLEYRHYEWRQYALAT